MRGFATFLSALAVAGLAVFWFVTRPDALPEEAVAGLAGDAVRGESVFWAAGCASCHSAPKAKGDDKLRLGGGRRFPSPFGTFVAPNISPDPVHGIGGWSVADLANAMMRGVSPDGAHYYPAFPYTSYEKAELRDIADLRAFLDTLPPVAMPSEPHEVGFPFNIRRSLGGWKLLFAGQPFVLAEAATPQLERGRYLVEALGHCGECHTPRNALGGLIRDRWLAGAPNPEGKGTIPNITPGGLKWSEADIVYYLETGFTPDFDSAGGQMVEVIDNMSKLPRDDLQAIAAYLLALPAISQ